jgi:hypothetical protein
MGLSTQGYPHYSCTYTPEGIGQKQPWCYNKEDIIQSEPFDLIQPLPPRMVPMQNPEWSWQLCQEVQGVTKPIGCCGFPGVVRCMTKLGSRGFCGRVCPFIVSRTGSLTVLVGPMDLQCLRPPLLPGSMIVTAAPLQRIGRPMIVTAAPLQRIGRPMIVIVAPLQRIGRPMAVSVAWFSTGWLALPFRHLPVHGCGR